MYFRIEKRKSTPLKIVLHITSFLLFLCNFNTIAQNSKNIENYTFDELSDKYYEYKFTDSLKAKKFANFYFNKAVKEKDTVNAIDGKYYLSEVYKNDSIYINYVDSIINFTTNNSSKMFPAYAYLDKGNLYFENHQLGAALQNYISGLKYTTYKKNDILKYKFKLRIGMLQEENKKYTEAKNNYLECLRFHKRNEEKINPINHISLLYNLSNLYHKINQIDSSRSYLDKALAKSLIIKDSIFIGYSFHKRAQLDISVKDYKNTIENAKKAIPLLIADENYRLLFNNYNLLARSYVELNDKRKALKFHLLSDSLYEKSRIPSKHLKYNFKFIANYYKSKGDLKNQLKYIEKQIFIDSIQTSDIKNLSKTFTEEYNRPKLIAEKQKIISELNNEVSFYKKSRIYIAIVLILSFILFLYQFRKRKKQEQKFDNLTIKLKNKKVVENSVNSNTNVQKTLPETIITELLAKLDSFEQQPENFTNNKLTLSILAKELETNSNYLSKVINQKKGCNFSTYLRKLRIDYALDLLEKDTTIRKFSVDAIAKEVGFKNAETFSKAFFKETELNPSFYIKQLEKKG